MITVFETLSGSKYEIDQPGKRIRRISGRGAATNRQGEDGQWRTFESTSPLELGYGLVIYWPSGTPLLEGSPPSAAPATMTSLVTWIGVAKEEPMTKGGLSCSFCGRAKDQAGTLVVSTRSEDAICFSCIREAQGPRARVAYCSACETVDGKHSEGCEGGAA